MFKKNTFNNFSFKLRFSTELMENDSCSLLNWKKNKGLRLWNKNIYYALSDRAAKLKMSASDLDILLSDFLWSFRNGFILYFLQF